MIALIITIYFVLNLVHPSAEISPVVSKASSGAAELIPISILPHPADAIPALKARGWQVVTTVARQQPVPDAPQLVPDAPQLVADAPQLVPDAPQLVPDAPQLVHDFRRPINGDNGVKDVINTIPTLPIDSFIVTKDTLLVIGECIHSSPHCPPF